MEWGIFGVRNSWIYLASRGETSIDNPILSNESRHNALPNGFSYPLSTECDLNLQELPTQQSSSNTGTFDDFVHVVAGSLQGFY